MRAYSRALYSDAVAAGLKDDFGEWLSVSSDLDATIERLRGQYGADEMPADADASTFWLALADLLHSYGLESPRVFEKAKAIIDSGLDLELRKEFVAEPVLRDREKMLLRLRNKWASPATRIRKIPKLRPERFRMRRGEVFTYDTMGGNPRHIPADPDAQRGYRFKRDATNAFICFNTARVFFDTEARYFIIPLALFKRRGKITLDECIDAQMITHCDMARRKFSPLGGWMKCSLRQFKMIDPKKIGTVDPNIDALAPVFGQTVYAPLSRHDGPSYPLWMNHGMLSSVVRGHGWGGAEQRIETFVKAWEPLRPELKK